MGSRDVLVVLHVANGRSPARECDRLRRALRAHYAPILDDVRIVAETVTAARTIVAAVTAAAALPTESDLWVWGAPIGRAGLATHAELSAAVELPDRARRLLGPFVVARLGESDVRLLTGPDVVHTLARCSGPAGVAYATKNWAGLLASGAPARLRPERVPEYVLFDQVWGDDELLDGPTLCEEATVVDLSSGGLQERSWWPVAERVAPGRTTSGPSLREVLTDELRRTAQVPDLALALTAGRDSSLVATCLHACGAEPLTYTFGGPGAPDQDGAAATAQALGWQHLSVGTADASPRQLADAVRASGWTEGLDTAWNRIGPPLRWPAALRGVHLSGSGGETGRAFYWPSGPVPATSRDVLDRLLQPAVQLPPATRGVLRDRLSPAVEAACETAGDAARDLDLLYARTRMRNWLNRTLPQPHVQAVVSAYTSPAMLQVLMGLPPAARQTGSGFDDACGPEALALRRAAADSHSPRTSQRLLRAAAERSAVLSGRVRGGHRLHLLLQRTAEGHDAFGVRLLAAARAELPEGTPVVDAALGPTWWPDTLSVAGHTPWARRQLWNAIAVEALSLRIAGWEAVAARVPRVTQRPGGAQVAASPAGSGRSC